MVGIWNLKSEKDADATLNRKEMRRASLFSEMLKLNKTKHQHTKNRRWDEYSESHEKLMSIVRESTGPEQS